MIIFVRQKICEARGWGAGHPRFLQTKETLNKVWDGLQKRADADNDGQVCVKRYPVLVTEFV